MDERFRGSSDVPLSMRGLTHARDVGIKLMQKGGLDEIKTSDLIRASDTAKAISRFTHAPITYSGDGLHPWALGALEGQKVTPERIELQHDLVHNEPDARVEGRGPLSTRDGESFNAFKERTLNFLHEQLSTIAANPQKRIGLVTHFRVKKLMDAWMRKGAQGQEIDPDVMTANSSDHSPASVDRVVVDPNAGPQAFSVDLDSPAQLGGGLYLIRHGETDWNSSQS